VCGLRGLAGFAPIWGVDNFFGTREKANHRDHRGRERTQRVALDCLDYCWGSNGGLADESIPPGLKRVMKKDDAPGRAKGPGLKPLDFIGPLPRAEARCYSGKTKTRVFQHPLKPSFIAASSSIIAVLSSMGWTRYSEATTLSASAGSGRTRKSAWPSLNAMVPSCRTTKSAGSGRRQLASVASL
jgi:hypothetical protein